ncbi:unnamed protein product [Larinioides sclopetarius]|uniref:CB1 cannabinoid receptor-interacting protein 1 n=1 Tax=Larinioides sclopetarius TaxID=280406 RepID=A0AAV2AGX0_9ARAC
MSQKDHKFQVSLSIKRDDGNAQVFYKQDGQRFDNDITIKMKVQTSYKFLLTVRPSQKIKLASLKGEELEMTSEEVNSESTNYAFEWNSNNIPVTKKNRRLSFNLILEIQNKGVLELPLQMKFYHATETNHSSWGKSLNSIEFNCLQKTGNSFIEILSTVYRS